jgi:hypothetical protein
MTDIRPYGPRHLDYELSPKLLPPPMSSFYLSTIKPERTIPNQTKKVQTGVKVKKTKQKQKTKTISRRN